MSLILHATSTDLKTGWLGETPDDAPALIRHASLLVTHTTRFDVYETDISGRPTSPEHLAAFRDATCQQVASWKAAGINPVAGAFGQTPQIAAQSTEGDSVTYTNLPTAADRARTVSELCPASTLILQAAGLASRMPRYL